METETVVAEAETDDVTTVEESETESTGETTESGKDENKKTSDDDKVTRTIARVKAERQRERDKANAAKAEADKALKEKDDLVKTLMKALGKGDDADEAPDAGKLTAELEKARSERNQVALEMAVLRLAPGKGVDPDALLDSRKFVKSIHALDPAADDLSETIADLIADAAEKNPRWRLQSVKTSEGQKKEEKEKEKPKGRSGGDFSGGAGKPRQMTGAEVEALRKAGKHDEISKALEDGRLASYMNSQ